MEAGLPTKGLEGVRLDPRGAGLSFEGLHKNGRAE